MKKQLIFSAVLSASLLLSACTRSTTIPRDPYEKFNRTVFAFNQGFDKVVYRPATRIYMMGLPGTVRKDISNAFNNITEITNLPNDLLQTKLHFFFHDFMRILINTTFGIGGFFDVASKVGLEHHEQSWGATLLYYSPKGTHSPYLVLPFIGSYTFTSALGLVPGYFTEPVSWIGSDSWRYSLAGLYLISQRSDFMDANSVVDNAFDPYVLVRNAFFQRHDKEMANILHEKKPGDRLSEED
jgi:phospholipid-binding lipoprotein MlaA